MEHTENIMNIQRLLDIAVQANNGSTDNGADTDLLKSLAKRSLILANSLANSQVNELVDGADRKEADGIPRAYRA
jgi:hypothetical protein